MGTHFKLLFLPEEILIEVNLHNCQALAPGPCSLNPSQVRSGWLVGLQDFSVSPSPLLGLFGLELGWTGLGLGLGGLGTRA